MIIKELAVKGIKVKKHSGWRYDEKHLINHDEEADRSDSNVAQIVTKDAAFIIKVAAQPGCRFTYRAVIGPEIGYSFCLLVHFPAHLKPPSPDG